MVVPKGRGLTTSERTDWNKSAGDDLIVVHTKRKGEKLIRIVNIYDQRATETGERPARRLNWQKIMRQGGGGMVLAGDFNAHSQLWDPRCTE